MSKPEYVDRCLYGHYPVWRHYPATGANEEVCMACGEVARAWQTQSRREDFR